ncbi:TIGR02679 family protein [Streptomyces sp. AV19]|uniref:TIGR02679 family protein n=1 Tax=Streptomyces sp. AV19 TaxID=2793068 RepID=UPI0018FE85FD|nr:TIGR02679 family protein [Streptomyces sp. AV19]MBH1938545.1 TIGR02679 family protein [Streptomyces sp. AV19]MDG4535194.1 TIGR02679 family protein [Streptomyces sp. AV19]
MSGTDVDRLRRLLGTPELAWLVERVRRRLEREQPLTGPVSLAAPTEAQRTAVERLLGRAPRPGRSLTVRLDAVDGVLRRSGISPGGLVTAVEALTGPVTPLRETRRNESRAWQQAFRPLQALGRDLPRLAGWAAGPHTETLVRRLVRTPEAAGPLTADAAKVLRELPAEPAVSLPAFAARTLGSAHALDDGTPLTTLTLSGIRALTGFPDGSGAAWRREAWASAGLLRDALSSTVLTLNLRGTPALDWMAGTGEPCVLTLRQLTHRPLRFAPRLVRICENPAVLAAAADAYGADCPPLVCLQGQPSAAALTLLRHLHERGADLLYHGDFDWGGFRIANVLLGHVPWHPWRFTASDYRTLAATASQLPPLTGAPAPSPWDPALSPALTELGVRVEEEVALAALMADLA